MSDAFRLFGAFVLNPGFSMVIFWWLTLVAVGLAFLPLTLRLFRGFYDGGYLFARLLGLLLPSYLVWLASSLGVAHLSRVGALCALLACAVMNYLLPGALSEVRALFREKKREILLQEYLFFAAFIAWALIRSMKPEIYGLEKFLNFGYVNSILRSESMPPVDMWMSGASINYYYFGHFFTAFMCRLTKIPAEIAYNLMLSTLFAFAFTLSYSLVSGLLRRIHPNAVKRAMAGGMLAAFLITAGANLQPFVYGIALPALQRAGLYNGEVKNYWYPTATRFIGHMPPTDDKTIHEFPAYAFVTADLHAHVMDTPASFAFIGIGASLLFSASLTGESASLRMPYREAAAGLLLGVTWMTNSWNYPIYLLVLLGAALFAALKRHGFGGRALAETLLAGLVLVAVSQAAVLPYTLHFKNMTEGVHRVMANSPLWQLAVLWGYQTFFALCFAVFFTFAAGKYLRERDPGQGRLLALIQRAPSPDIVALGMFAAAFCLVLIPEIVYVKDIYGKTYHRANTMFKMAYQASLLFSLASAYAAFRIAGAIARRGFRTAVILLFALVLSMPLVYMRWALPGYYGRASIAPEKYQWLDGLAYMPSGDREVVRWLEQHVQGRPTILEADGNNYTTYGRISMATGLPTVLGWFGHSWSMRGDIAEPNKRRAAVSRIYESGDPAVVRRLLEEYGVRYIVVGALEREKFKKIKESVLEGMGEVVFRHPDGSVIIKVNSSESKEEIEP